MEHLKCYIFRRFTKNRYSEKFLYSHENVAYRHNVSMNCVQLKRKLFYLEKFEFIENYIRQLKSYIKYYNIKRIKIKLKGISPVEYKTKFQLIV